MGVRKELVIIGGLALLGIMIVLILVLIWAWIVGNRDTSNSEIIQLTSPVGQLYQCRDYSCQSGLSCDQQAGLCKKNDGKSCVKGSECLSTSYCSGICVSNDPGLVTGLPGDPCPCGVSMTCITEGDGTKICKRNQGVSCNSDQDCLSDRCLSGVCSAGQPNGSTCTSDSQCGNNNCSAGYCQDQGVSTGDSGATCNPAPCNQGNSCLNGTCVETTRGLNDPCNVSQDICILPLQCYTVPQPNVDWDPLIPCSDDSQICSCQYPVNSSEPDPNICTVTDVCTDSYRCIGGSCSGLSGVGVPCLAIANCESGNCGSNPAVVKLLYSTIQTVNGNTQSQTGSSLDDFFSNYDVSFEVLPHAIPQATRLTGIDDTIFLVSPDSGVVQAYGSGLTVIEPQSQSTDNGTTTTLSLIDATMYGETQGFALFKATVDQDSTVTTSVVLYQLTNSGLIPYNVTDDPPGTQFTGTTAINAAVVEYQPISQVLGLQDTNGLFYYLPDSGTGWNLMPETGTSSRTYGALEQPKFYYDNDGQDPTSEDTTCIGVCDSHFNISYIDQVTINDNVGVKFNGNAKGIVVPTLNELSSQTGDVYQVKRYSIYTPSEGLSNSLMGALVNAPGGRTLLYIGAPSVTAPVPGFYSTDDLILATSEAIYLYVSGTCL